MSNDSVSNSLAELPNPRLIERFRGALARRGVPALPVVTSPSSWTLTCPACFDAAAEGLGLGVERLEPLEGEAGVFERYDQIAWRSVPALEDDDPHPEEVVGDEPQRGQVSFYAPSRFGLFRLAVRDAGLETGLWLWFAQALMGPQLNNALLVATRERALFEQLVAETHRRHVAHERARPGLLVLSGHSETRAATDSVSWERVLLPDALRDDLARTVREFFASAELYRRHHLPHRRGILLAGPPGNGKTTILRAIRASAGVPVLVSSLDDLGHAVHIRQAFERAAELAPAVLCFEDLDSLVGDGPQLSQFLNLLDGLERLEGVLVVATTNRPEKIDPAIARRPSRFDRIFAIQPPDRELREVYLQRELGEELSAATATKLAARTEGYSVAFLKELVIQARFAAVRRGDERVRDSDLDEALVATGEHIKIAARGLELRGEVGFARGA